MNHFGEQNGPFCDAERLILKNGTTFLPVLFGFFTEKEWIGALKRRKICAGFFGNFI